MSGYWPPPNPYKTRYALKAEMQGFDVAALQINLKYFLSLDVDGNFGPQTDAAVRSYQKRRALYVDGIAGPVTQKFLALELIRPGQSFYNVAPGLLRGICEGESGWVVGAVNWNSPGGVDCGWIQRRVLTADFNDINFTKAFDGKIQFDLTGQALRVKKDEYVAIKDKDGNPISDDRRSWELATLYHNWKVAANKFAQGINDFNYVETLPDGTKVTRTMDEPAHWIISIGVPGVSTGRQWCDHYISSKCLYVSSWVK